MDPAARFQRLVQGSESGVRLDEGALLIAAHAHPGLDVDAEVARIDALAAACPAPTFEALRTHLFGTLGFRGNVEDYGDPRNSYLNDVLDRRVGLPITLSVLVLEVGRRLGVPFVGIGLPGHFVVRHEAVPRVLLDPFEGGRLLTPEDCAERVASIYGDAVAFTPDMLQPVGTRAILARMLANLKQRFALTGDVMGAEWALRLRTAIPEVDTRELGELAGAQAAIGHFRAAAETLEDMATQLPEDAAAKAVARARRLRARLN
ncbi:MAG TPA: transglutaminase-like domain-containing protein [Acidimicrobiales bacterium]|nr:transglutaminase-like domain-containing protein [Acidimicrobiales bacterium]